MFDNNLFPFPCRFTDTVCSGLHPHQPVLLHGEVRLPGSPLDPPRLDVWLLLLPPLLQLLDTGLHEGQAAPRRNGQAKTERLHQRTHHCGGQWETPGEWERAPPHQRQNPPGQSKGNLSWWLWTWEGSSIELPWICHSSFISRSIVERHRLQYAASKLHNIYIGLVFLMHTCWDVNGMSCFAGDLHSPHCVCCCENY